MYLKSLTLKGFKSFASSTTLQLEPGITCIVGPNGSGKSNVVDALAWVMGEQGAKSLRGGKMEDVIFAGTSGRPPLGRAEVAADHRQRRRRAADRVRRGHDQPDHVPQRRLGVRHQRQPCRLLDVQELLSDSGIGREMHVIVGQGQLDTILHATPEDRRGFIEEAAGVLKHRKRKEKALRKLDSTEGNLTRLNDLLSEIRRQLKPLGRQAEVARRARRRPGRRPRRPGPAAGRRPGHRAHRARAGARRRDDPAGAPGRGRGRPSPRPARPRPRSRPRCARTCPRWRRPRRPGSRCPGCASGSAAPSRWPPSGSATPPTSRGPDRERPRPRAARGRGRAGPRAGAGDRRRGRPSARRRSRRPSTARKAAEDAAAEEERRVAGLQRAAADRREGLARLHGQVNALRSPRRRRRRRGRPARPGPRGRPRPRRARPARLHLAGDPGRRPRRRRGGPRRRARGGAGSPLDDLDERLAKTREEAQQAERERAARWPPARTPSSWASTARTAPARCSPPPTRSPGCSARSPRCSSVRSGYETAVAAALGSAADAVAVRDVDAAVGAIGHLKADDLGRAGLLLGGGPADRPRLARPARPRDVRRRRRRLPGRPASARSARLLFKVAVVDDLDAARGLVRELPDVTAVTRDGDLLGAHFASGGSAEPAEPDRGPGRRRRGHRAQLAEAVAACRAARLRPRPGSRPSGIEAQQRVDVALAKLHESDATLAAVAEELGQHGSLARAAARRGRAARRGDRQRRAGPRQRPRRPRRARGAARRGRGRPRRGARHRRPRAARRGGPPGPRRARWTPGWRCAPPRSAPAPCTAAPTRWCAPPRPSARRGPGPPSAASG